MLRGLASPGRNDGAAWSLAGFQDDIRECGRRAQGDDPLLTKDIPQKLTRVFSNYEAIDAGLREDGYPGWVVTEFMRALGKGAVRPIVRRFYYAARDAYADGSRVVGDPKRRVCRCDEPVRSRDPTAPSSVR